jgi:hypothetical protein
MVVERDPADRGTKTICLHDIMGFRALHLA